MSSTATPAQPASAEVPSTPPVDATLLFDTEYADEVAAEIKEEREAPIDVEANYKKLQTKKKIQRRSLHQTPKKNNRWTERTPTRRTSISFSTPIAIKVEPVTPPSTPPPPPSPTIEQPEPEADSGEDIDLNIAYESDSDSSDDIEMRIISYTKRPNGKSYPIFQL